MGIEYDTEEKEYEDIMATLDEASAMRDTLKEKDSPDKPSRDHRLSRDESNEADVYEETSVESAPEPDHRPAKTLKDKGGSSATDVHKTDRGNGGDKKRKEKISVTETVKLEKALQKLEKNYIGSQYDTLKTSQKKYIRNLKRAMTRRFKSYADFVEFCNERISKGRMIDPEEYLLYHVIYTMPHPELYVDLFGFDVFSPRYEAKGKYTQISDFFERLNEDTSG